MRTIKTISKLTMMLAFVAFANTLLATGNLKVNLLPLNSETAVVAISSVQASYFQISIANNKGEVVYFKETDTESIDYRKVFDFSNLEDGDYKLSVNVDATTTEREFSIKNHNIVVGKEKSSIEPFFSYKDGILKLSYLNFSEEKLNLNFYNENELIFTKAIDNDFSVQEGYNLSKLDKGVYSVVLSTNYKSYTYNVEVE